MNMTNIARTMTMNVWLLGRLLTRVVFVLLIVAINAPSLAAAQSVAAIPITPESMANFFDTMIAQQMADAHVVGATVSVVKDGELLFAKGYGYADLAQKTPVVAEKTLFYPGSAGKLFTWTALMQLVETGKLDLADDINRYLDFDIPATFAEPITIKHLLTHTTGFEEQLEALQVGKQSDVLPLREFLMRAMPARVYAPGTTFAYSNYATVLAGYIVERISEEPFEQYVTEHILVPLEMTHSSAYQPLPADLMTAFSKGYHYRNGEYIANDFEWIASAPAAPIRATATDMAKFMLAQLNDCQFGDRRILQAATCAAMQQEHFAHDPHVNGMGLGFMVSEQNGQTIVWHTGGSAHFNTMLALIPEQDIGFYVSYNTPIGDLYQPLVSFVDHFYPQPNPTPIAPPADTAGRIAALRGTYVSSRVAHQSSQKLVTWFSETLNVQPGTNNTVQVGPRTYAESEPSLFRQVDGPRQLTYRTNDQGEVVQLFFAQFAYFKVPWIQALTTQLLLAAISLLIMLTAIPAWAVDWLIRRRRGAPSVDRWARTARWAVVLLSLLNIGVLVWFLLLMSGFADTFVFPAAMITVITWLWSINIPAVLALVVFAVLAWQRHYWRPAWRVHYTVVTVAAAAFLWFLANWNLLVI